MAFGSRLIAVVLAGMFSYMPTAWAFYAQASTPFGFSGSAGNWLYAAKRTDQIIGGIVRQAAASSVNVGGQSVRMAAAYRYGALAGRAAAGIIFAHPGLAIGTAVGIAAWLALSKVRWDVPSQTWQKKVESDTSMCPAYSGPPPRGSVIAVPPGGVNLNFQCLSDGGSQGAGYCGYYDKYAAGYSTGFACDAVAAQPVITVENPTWEPVTQPEFVSRLGSYPMPDTVPQELPEPSPLPIEGDPVLNPSPGTNPQPQPMRVPTGDPVPTANPGEWRTPYTDIVPSPAPSTPWRVDVKPGDIIQTSPTPLPDPTVVDPLAPSPPGTVVTPRTEDQLDLCQKYPNSAMCQPPVEAPPVKDPIDLCLEHPEIVACQKLGDVPTPEVIPNDDKQIMLTPDAGWGSAGACPAPRHITLAGGMSFDIPLDLLCDFARMIRPLIVAMAYLGAAMMLVGAARRE